jgi:hypothetical protein
MCQSNAATSTAFCIFTFFSCSASAFCDMYNFHFCSCFPSDFQRSIQIDCALMRFAVMRKEKKKKRRIERGGKKKKKRGRGCSLLTYLFLAPPPLPVVDTVATVCLSRCGAITFSKQQRERRGRGGGGGARLHLSRMHFTIP